MRTSEKYSLPSHRDNDTGCDAWHADIESARALLAGWIAKTIDEKWGTAVAAERATGVSQTEFSRIRNGKLRRYTLERLVRLLNALNNDIEVRLEVKIRQRRP